MQWKADESAMCAINRHLRLSSLFVKTIIGGMHDTPASKDGGSLAEEDVILRGEVSCEVC
jgi:hypothetical protein